VLALLVTGCTVNGNGAVGSAGHVQDGRVLDPRPRAQDEAVRLLRHLAQRLRQALVAGDVRTAGRVLAPEFVAVAENHARSRARYLGTVSSGDLDYRELTTVTPLSVRVSGGRAVVTYGAHVAATAGGIRIEHDAWYTHVYEQGLGGWREVREQVTAVRAGGPARRAHRCPAGHRAAHRTSWSRSTLVPAGLGTGACPAG